MRQIARRINIRIHLCELLLVALIYLSYVQILASHTYKHTYTTQVCAAESTNVTVKQRACRQITYNAHIHTNKTFDLTICCIYLLLYIFCYIFLFKPFNFSYAYLIFSSSSLASTNVCTLFALFTTILIWFCFADFLRNFLTIVVIFIGYCSLCLYIYDLYVQYFPLASKCDT